MKVNFRIGYIRVCRLRREIPSGLGVTEDDRKQKMRRVSEEVERVGIARDQAS